MAKAVLRVGLELCNEADLLVGETRGASDAGPAHRLRALLEDATLRDSAAALDLIEPLVAELLAGLDAAVVGATQRDVERRQLAHERAELFVHLCRRAHAAPRPRRRPQP